MFVQDLQGCCPHYPPKDFRMVETAKNVLLAIVEKYTVSWSPGFYSPGSIFTVGSLLSICNFS